ncbi:MAG: diaminopimelate decarboxylase [Anaerolinea sp.]|nr:diaminopimelate decarboxylase [Anaerolinea sp.]
MLNTSIHYENGRLFCDGVAVAEIAAQVGTPAYIYSGTRFLSNLRRIQAAFPTAHIHYSAKANGNLAIMKMLVNAGAGIDAVSAGEIHRALIAGAQPENIVFAGVGKTGQELYYALSRGVGWFNIENVEECRLLNSMAGAAQMVARVALRLNPDVAANTHRHIATGHGKAKFGMSTETIRDLLTRQGEFSNLSFEGIHIHIGSQLHDTTATQAAIRAALDVIQPYPTMRTVDIGGGLPVAYSADEIVPDVEAFAASILPLLEGYEVILEPGRAIIADAGMLITRVQYIKEQGEAKFAIVDAGMTELIRPALYEAHHEIVPLVEQGLPRESVQVVGPVCETTDVLGRDVALPPLAAGDCLAVLTAGAYGMVMASNYNARPRPPEVLVDPNGKSWYLVRRRETWDDLVAPELA